ncbi:MAG: serine hydrolase domain-containing protein [Ginsengibacter sp.]
MKNLLYVFFYALLITSCSSKSSDNSRTAREDTSLILPVPGGINREDFIRYHRAVKSFYDSFLLPRGFNGAFLVAKKGTIIFEAYNGFSNATKKDSLNEHSSFHLASVSKTFTAMGILKLAEQGKLNLDDDLSLFFPSFPYPGVTIKMLLNHRSGLPNYIYFMQKLGWDVSKVSSNQDVLNYLIQFKPPVTHQPGTRFNYCNTNYALLALIIEKVSGKSYAQFLKDTFFTPLQMNDTYVFSMADSGKALPSYDWRWRPEVFNFLDGEYGDKNVYSTAKDLLKWDQGLYSNKLFTPQTLQAAFTPYSNEKPGIKNYGLGWRMNVYPDGKKIIFHTGWWHGNNSILVRLIEDSATIIALGNKFNRAIYDAKKLANIFQHYFDTDEDDKVENNTETISTDEPKDTSVAQKMKFPKVKSHRRHRHK